MAKQSTRRMAAQDELTLLERVFLRIGSAETDEQLQNAVFKFLPPILLKLSSQQEGVRKKVMELLIHINKRIKSRPKIQLPVETLLLQYQDPAATSFVTNFTIIYIRMGYPRMDLAKQAELAPCLINSLEGKPQSHQDSLLLMLMPVLTHIKLPADIEKRKTLFGLYEKPRVVKLLLDFMLDLLLLPYGVTIQPAGKASSATQVGESSSSSGNVSAIITPPGLSEYAFKRLTGENALNPEQLEQAKLGIVKFISSGILSEDDVVVLLIIASSDSRHSVANTADTELRRIYSGLDLNNATVVSKLYSIFLGTVLVKDQSSIKPEYKRVPANIRIRLKIFAHLLKSREATLQFPAAIQVIFDCLYGTNTNQKMKVMALQFVHHVCYNCNETRLTPFGPVLLSGMVKLIAETEDANLRGLAYIAVGKLGQKLPQLIMKDMALVQSFFDAMCKEDQNTRLAIQEALLIMLPLFKKLDSANAKLMEALLLSSIEKPEHQVRMLAVQYAFNIFPTDNIPSRYVILLASDDVKDDVRSEALRYLRTVSDKGSDDKFSSNVLPNFPDLIAYINEKAVQRIKSSYKFVIGNNSLAFSPNTICEMLSFLRMSLWSSAGIKITSSDLDETQTPLIANYIQSLLQTNIGDKNPIHLYINFMKQFLSAAGGSKIMQYLLEIIAVVPSLLSGYFVNNLDWLKNLMYSTKEEVRESSAELYAIVVAYSFDSDMFLNVLQLLLQNANDTSAKDNIEQQHGAILALGFAISCKLRLILPTVSLNFQIPDIIYEIVQFLAFRLNSNQALINSAVCIALSEIGRSGFFPVRDSDGSVSIPSIAKDLIKFMEKSNNSKVREKAISAIGCLCLSIQGVEHNQKIIEDLMVATVEMKDVELQCTIGESLASAILGPNSNEARNHWTVTEAEFKPAFMYTPVHGTWLIDKIITNYAYHVKETVRMAACVWLLTLLKKCHAHVNLQDRLEKIQQVFITLLAEKNEFTQDMASKGLSLIYEYSPAEQRSKMVSILVDTLTSGGRATQQVTPDTKVFDEGAIPNPLGGNLSTYKELCSFATDLHQPDLVYKFMNLARHNAIWNSKKGAAFGFGSIASKAGEQLTPHLPQIVPRLFRYQFDPNTKIQQSMMSIWQALVPEPQKMIDKYLKEIVDDILENLTNNSWRVRESCCLALADLLRGRQVDTILDKFPAMWETCFRVRDDIKESVRLAAETALKTLSKVSIKLCDASTGESRHIAIGYLLPVLLKSGLGSTVKEVRKVSLDTVVKMSKHAGIQLKPHLPLLIAALLESLSMMEMTELNYLSVRLGNEQNQQEAVDNERVSLSKASPMMSTINHCVQYIDSSVLQEIIERLIELMRSNVGLITKAGCSTFIISLTHQCPQDVQLYAGKLMSALVNGLNDRNPVIRKNYATSLGHLVKCAKSNSIEKLLNKLRLWYMEKEEESVRNSCGYTLQAIARQNSDVLKDHAANAMPLAFLAMHAPKQKGNKISSDHQLSVWEEIWLDITPGTESGIRLYLTEITDITQQALGSAQWGLKAQGALAIATVATKMGSNLESSHVFGLLRILLAALTGRTWTGKEALLSAIKAICSNCKETLKKSSEESPSVNEIIDAVIKECRKENLSYKREAFQCLAEILYSLEEDRFTVVLELVLPLINKDRSGNGDANDDDSEFDGKEKEEKRALRETSFELLGRAWPRNVDTQAKYIEDLNNLFVNCLNSSDWKVQIIIVKTIRQIFERLYLLEMKELSTIDEQNLINLIVNIIRSLNICIESTKFTVLRSEVLNVIEVILTKLNENGQLKILPDVVKTSINDMLNNMKKDSQPELKDKSSSLLKVIST